MDTLNPLPNLRVEVWVPTLRPDRVQRTGGNPDSPSLSEGLRPYFSPDSMFFPPLNTSHHLCQHRWEEDLRSGVQPESSGGPEVRTDEPTETLGEGTYWGMSSVHREG